MEKLHQNQSHSSFQKSRIYERNTSHNTRPTMYYIEIKYDIRKSYQIFYNENLISIVYDIPVPVPKSLQVCDENFTIQRITSFDSIIIIHQVYNKYTHTYVYFEKKNKNIKIHENLLKYSILHDKTTSFLMSQGYSLMGTTRHQPEETINWIDYIKDGEYSGFGPYGTGATSVVSFEDFKKIDGLYLVHNLNNLNSFQIGKSCLDEFIKIVYDSMYISIKDIPRECMKYFLNNDISLQNSIDILNYIETFVYTILEKLEKGILHDLTFENFYFEYLKNPYDNTIINYETFLIKEYIEKTCCIFKSSRDIRIPLQVYVSSTFMQPLMFQIAHVIQNTYENSILLLNYHIHTGKYAIIVLIPKNLEVFLFPSNTKEYIDTCTISKCKLHYIKYYDFTNILDTIIYLSQFPDYQDRQKVYKMMNKMEKSEDTIYIPVFDNNTTITTAITTRITKENVFYFVEENKQMLQNLIHSDKLIQMKIKIAFIKIKNNNMYKDFGKSSGIKQLYIVKKHQQKLMLFIKENTDQVNVNVETECIKIVQYLKRHSVPCQKEYAYINMMIVSKKSNTILFNIDNFEDSYIVGKNGGHLLGFQEYNKSKMISAVNEFTMIPCDFMLKLVLV